MRDEGYYWVRFGHPDEDIDIALWQEKPFPAWKFVEEGPGIYPVDGKFGASISPISDRLIPPST